MKYFKITKFRIGGAMFIASWILCMNEGDWFPWFNFGGILLGLAGVYLMTEELDTVVIKGGDDHEQI